MDCGNVSLLWREYLPLAANALTNSPKFSDPTKRDVFQLYPSLDVDKMRKKQCLPDFSSILHL